MDRSVCRGCGAQILWATTRKGKHIPLDEKPEQRFVLVAATTELPEHVEQVTTYMPHHATCPKVEEFRKPR